MSLTDIDTSQFDAEIATKNARVARSPYMQSAWFEVGPISDVSLDDRLARLDRKRWQFTVKAVIDRVGSVVALVMLSPLLIAVAIAIKLTSKGPVLFRQERWGRNLQKIWIYKFRSMYADQCDHTGVAQTMENDPRVTPLGIMLRRFNIDELPQLFNVIKGDMSLVGPRCHAVGMKAAGVLYEELAPEYHLRHLVRPGMTGLAQIRGLRGPTTRASKARARLASDLYYIDNYSLLLDLKIAVRTIVGKGSVGF